MSHGNHQVDVPNTVTSYFFLGDFNSTTVTNNSFVSDTLVFTTGTLKIFDRTKDSLTKQTVTFGFVGSVVDRFRLENFASGIAQDDLRGGQTYGYFIEFLLGNDFVISMHNSAAMF
jgi:hypothetical protein